ncbi:hypothetical protein ASF74_14830 [Arthrobacter sp. Leaf145]|nr:hypothetical protein ASF74_14830 [Arthrobacter sp. Leaf145]
MSDQMSAAENAYRETITELRLAEGGGFKVASQHRRALEAAINAAAPFIAAQAWDEGWDRFADYDELDQQCGEYPANPYRSV